MEAVPRMPMLSFELKHSPEYVEFGPTLKKYIQDHYGEDPAHYNKSCNELEQLRQGAVHVSHDFMGCSTLKKYYSQLQFLQGRFPMLEGGEAAIPFTWEEVYSGREMTLSDIKFEQACVLYNIGALHSVLGAMDTRQSADGMKVSCTHFQCASWAFEYLRDHFGSAAMSLDMSHELLTFKVYLMLAQAQECILEKSMTDSRKSAITSKVSAQIVEFYMTALKHLDVCNSHEFISSKRYKDWKKRIDIKVMFYTCITNFYMGCQSEEQQKRGQCLAYFTLALDKLTECEKLAKSEIVEIQDSLRFTHDVVGGKHQSAKKDNDFVYHDKIPAADTLPEVKGASLVKGIPFNPNDPEISGPDIFNKLVPMSAHEAASLYSEEKATLLRRIVSEMQEKDEELTQYLASLQLDQTSLNPEPERLPQQLLEKCAALSVRPTAIKDLVDSMTAVSNVATDVDLGIKEIQQTLQEESTAELEYQATFGKRNPNAILSEIAQECARLEEGHKKGSQSNTDLHKAMNTHINNLKLLSSPLDDLQKLLPSVDKNRDPESDDVIKLLNTLLSKIDEMRTQRQTLEDSLRKEILEDDITGVLVQQEGINRDVLFKEQLKKHDQTTTFIRQNLSAQSNILRALTDANAKYANVRRATSEALVKREQTIRDLINSYEVYEDLKAKSLKGLDFYKKLETNVGRLLTRCRNVCKVQHDERQKIYNKYRPKVPPQPKVPRDTQNFDASGKPPSGPLAPRGNIVETIDSLPDAAGSFRPPGPHSTMAAMFDGPKLKDYLPFMKPKSFGKDGSPPISAAHPNVQDFINQGGSLPNSGTASPVHLPHMSDSVPASPDHIRHRLDGRLGPTNTAASRAVPHQPGPDLTQGHLYQPVISMAQSQIPQGYEFVSQFGPDEGQMSLPGTPYQQQLGQGQPSSQGQPTSQTDYVPLDQAWKKDKQDAQMSKYTSQGQRPTVSRSLKPRQDPVDNSSIQPSMQNQQHNYDPNISMSNPAMGYIQPGQNMPSMPLSAPATQDQAYLNQYNQSPVQSQVQVPYQQPMGSQSGGHMTSFVQPVLPPHSVPNRGQREETNTVSSIGGPVVSPASQGESGQGHVSQQGHMINQQYQAQMKLTGQLTQPTGQLGYMPQNSQQSNIISNTSQYIQNQPPVSAAFSPQGLAVSQGQGNIPVSQFQAQIPVSPNLSSRYQSAQQHQQQFPTPGQQPQVQQQNQPSAYQTGALGNQAQHQVIPTGTSNQYGQTLPSSGPLNQGYPGQCNQAKSRLAAQSLPAQLHSNTQPPYVASQGQQQPYSTLAPKQGMLRQADQGHPGVIYQQGQPQGQQTSLPQVAAQQPQMYHNVAPHSHYQDQRISSPGFPSGQVQSAPGTGQQFRSPATSVPGQGQVNIGQSTGGHPVQQMQQPPPRNFQQSQYHLPSSSMNPNMDMQTAPRFTTPTSSIAQGQQYQQNVPVPSPQGQGQIRQPWQQQPNQGNQIQPNVRNQQQPALYSASQNLPTWQQQNVTTLPASQSQGHQPRQQFTGGQVQSGAGFSTPTSVSQPPATMYGSQQVGTNAPAAGYGSLSQQVQKPSVPNYSDTPVNRQFTQGVLPQTQFASGVQGQQNLPQGHLQMPGSQGQSFPVGQTPSNQRPGVPNQAIGPQFGQVPNQYSQTVPSVSSQYLNKGQMNVNQPVLQPQIVKPAAPVSSGQPLTSVTAQHGPQTGATQGQSQTVQPPNQKFQNQSDTTTRYQTMSPTHGNYAGQQIVTGQVTPGQQIKPKDPEIKPSTPLDIGPAVRQVSQTSDQRTIPIDRQLSTASSLDEILSSSPNAKHEAADGFLAPKVLTAQEIQQQKEDQLKNSSQHVQLKDPYKDKPKLDRFIAEVEKLAKFVEGFEKPLCSGPTPLDVVWKELMEEQDKAGRKQRLAIARCYPMKNRDQDIMPYDDSRVLLTTLKDDYINASWINDLSPSCPKFIGTQAPLPVTLIDYWLMVYEQGVEVLVALSSDIESGKKFPAYLPKVKGETVEHGTVQLTLQSIKQKQFWTERILHLRHAETKTGRTLVHLEYSAWPISGFPDKVSHLLQFITEVHSFYRQQRSLLKPIVVHCGNGVGRTGMFVLIYVGMQEINHGDGLINVQEVAGKMLWRRRNVLLKQDQLKFCYEAILYYAQDVLAKEGILVHKASFGDQLPKPGAKSVGWEPGQDILFGSMSFTNLQSNIAKLGTKTETSSTNIDQKLEMLKKGDMIETTEGTSLIDGTGSENLGMLTQSRNLLPDVVQNPGIALERISAESVVNEVSTEETVADAASNVTDSLSQLSLKQRDSSSSLRSLDSIGSQGVKQSSVNSSPMHQSRDVSISPKPEAVSSSVSELQDPTKFTIGTSEGCKKKVTKADFTGEKKTNVEQDPNDPLSSLDPFWTVK